MKGPTGRRDVSPDRTPPDKPDWIDAEDPPHDIQCSKCFAKEDELIEGEFVKGHYQERTATQKAQEITILKCPECGLQWGH